MIAVEFFLTTDILDEMLIFIRDVLQDHGLPFGFVQAKCVEKQTKAWTEVYECKSIGK